MPYWGNEAGHRGFLLELGRSVGGTHFLAIDADEAIVAGTPMHMAVMPPTCT